MKIESNCSNLIKNPIFSITDFVAIKYADFDWQICYKILNMLKFTSYSRKQNLNLYVHTSLLPCRVLDPSRTRSKDDPLNKPGSEL